MGTFHEEHAAMIAATDTELGDTIQYRPKGGGWMTLVGPIVERADAARDIGTGIVIAQDFKITISKRLVPIKPSKGSQIQIPNDEVTYRCVNTHELDDDWLVELESA